MQSTTSLLLGALSLAVSSATASVFDDNPSVSDAHLTVRGSDFLWAIFSCMLASALGFTIWAMMLPVGKRAFHWIGVALLFTASIAYFSMASNLGATPVNVEFVRYSQHLYTDRNINPYTRDIWYARYIDWVVTTPLLLLELLLSTGMPLSDIMITLFMDEFMIIGGLIGALVPSVYKWGYFVGACIAMFFVFYQLMVPARSAARALGKENYSVYTVSTSILLVLWLLYPVAWGLSDGGNVIPTDSEMVFYGVLDLLAKPVFLGVHLFMLSRVPYEQFQLSSGHYSVGAPNGQLNGHQKVATA